MKIRIFTLAILTVILAATTSIIYSEETKAKAVANIKGTAPDSMLTGIVNLEETAEGVLIKADFVHVPNPGKHGFHVHEKGDCSDNGKAAGGHFNPEGVTHGYLPTDGHEKAHCGDMGNITIAEDGTGKLEMTLPGTHLTGDKDNISGLAIILHEKADDFSQPTGNAGGRIGCGIITPLDNLPQIPNVVSAPKTEMMKQEPMNAVK